jgi:DNA-directed RNA polymerase subunit K/omega
VAQKGFDILRTVTESRYLLSEIVGQRAAQLKRGVPSTVTGKVIPDSKNAVTAAMEEIELGTGVIWGKDVSTAQKIKLAVASDEKASREMNDTYTITQVNTPTKSELDSSERPKRTNHGAF